MLGAFDELESGRISLRGNSQNLISRGWKQQLMLSLQSYSMLYNLGVVFIDPLKNIKV